MKLALIVAVAVVAFATPAAARAQQQTPSPTRTMRAEAAAMKAVLVKAAPTVRTSRTGVVRAMTRPPKSAVRNERQR